MAERLAYGRSVFDEADEFAEWYDDGAAILADLRAAVHGEIDPNELVEARVRHWQKYGRKLEAGAYVFGHPRLRRWIRDHPGEVAEVARGQT